MDPILTNLSTYSGKYAKGLIGQVFRNLLAQEVTILQTIKGPTKFAKLKVSRGLKPYTGTFSAGNILDYSDRELSPKMAQFDINIDPRKYRDSFMTESIEKNSKYYGIPEENFVWMKILEELADEIVQYSIFLGDTASGDNAKKIVDGFQKIITAMSLTPIATGAIDDTNAVAKFEQMFSEAVATNSVWRNRAMNLWCSYENAENYVKNYRAVFPNDPSIYSDGTKPMFIKISNGKTKITPVDWITDDSLILAPKENLVMGTDKLSDLNTINTIQDVYSLKAGISFTMAFQVLDDEAIWVNDQL